MTGDLTTPLHRTVTQAEAASLRRLIWANLRRGWLRTLAQFASLAGMFAVVGLVERWFGQERWWQRALAIEALLGGIFGLIALYQTRRLLALRDLAALEVRRAVSALHGGYAQLFTPDGFRSQNLFSWSYRLHPLPHRELSPTYLWQLDLVRTRHGGPEQYFVLASVALRQASDEERRLVEKYLWDIGVYQHPD